jgi:hypothetical protein
MRRQDDLRRQEEIRRLEELRRQEQFRRQEVPRSPNQGFMSPLVGAVGQSFPASRVMEAAPPMIQPSYGGHMMWTDQGSGPGARWAGLR